MLLNTQLRKTNKQWVVLVQRPNNGRWEWSEHFGNTRTPKPEVVEEKRRAVVARIKTELEAAAAEAVKLAQEVE